MHRSDAFRIAIATAVVLSGFFSQAESARLVGPDPSLPDTVTIVSAAIPHSLPAVLDITVSNDEPLAVLEITLRISEGQAVIDSAKFLANRIPAGAGKWLRLAPDIVAIFVIPSSGDLLAAGSGPFCRLFLSYPAVPKTQTIYFDTTTYLYNMVEHTTFFTDSSLLTFRPVFIAGTVEILPSCCDGERGNIDLSPDQIVDIADLSLLIDYLFLSTDPRLPCPGEADLDSPTDNTVDVSDLSRLIGYLFIDPARTPLPSCP